MASTRRPSRYQMLSKEGEGERVGGRERERERLTGTEKDLRDQDTKRDLKTLKTLRVT